MEADNLELLANAEKYKDSCEHGGGLVWLGLTKTRKKWFENEVEILTLGYNNFQESLLENITGTFLSDKGTWHFSLIGDLNLDQFCTSCVFHQTTVLTLVGKASCYVSSYFDFNYYLKVDDNGRVYYEGYKLSLIHI